MWFSRNGVFDGVGVSRRSHRAPTATVGTRPSKYWVVRYQNIIPSGRSHRRWWINSKKYLNSSQIIGWSFVENAYTRLSHSKPPDIWTITTERYQPRRVIVSVNIYPPLMGLHGGRKTWYIPSPTVVLFQDYRCLTRGFVVSVKTSQGDNASIFVKLRQPWNSIADKSTNGSINKKQEGIVEPDIVRIVHVYGRKVNRSSDFSP